MKSFTDVYRSLNPEQKLAVDTVEGPVMVLAGPGTGKTQVLAVRVANILKKTQAKPSNILCLTFSNAGAVAMRERLRDLIGADAYGVTVNTVHGFCDNLIRRHSTAFSEWAELTALSDLDRYKLLEKLIDKVSHESVLINPRNPYSRTADILSRISDCKREGKSLEILEKVADLYDKEMAGKSKEGTKANTKNQLQAKKFRSFIDFFARYQEALIEEGKYDYDDMILTVLRVLNEEDWLLQGLQERYQYILIDEAQDLNGAQWAVIERLTTYDAVLHEPNFFLVGDDDQAIYRFQGANIAHMLAFKERFPKAPVIVLTKSYRSTQEILDAAGRLIAHNDERLVGKIKGLTKDLNAMTKEKGEEPTLVRSPSDAAEPWLLADMIDERLKQKVPLEEIAVLVQTNRELRPIYDVLTARGIPVLLSGKADLLTHPVVLQAVTILRFLHSDSDTRLLHALAIPSLGCHPADLARLAAFARVEKVSVMDVILSIETRTKECTDPTTLIAARDKLLDLRVRQESRTLLQTVEHVLRECSIATSSLDPLDLATVEAFFHHVRDRSLEHPSLTLASFLRDLELYADEEYGQVRLTYQLPHLTSSGVQLMTAHQSKGLEFHTVFLMSFRDGHWDQRRAHGGLSVPEELLFGWESEKKRAEKHQDERRVAYVAMTRAKRELILLCPKEFSVGERVKEVSPSAFFAEAGPLPEADRALQEAEKSSLLLHVLTRDIDKELRAYLLEKLEDFALSPSSLTEFLKDPQVFLRHSLLGQPEAVTEQSLRSLGYGNAVHWALRKWAEAKKVGKKFSSKDFLEQCSWYLENRAILTDNQKRDLLSQASSDLPRYFEEHLEASTMFLHAAEHEYRAHLGDIPIKGKIDRIDRPSETDAHAIIIDYKTGTPKTPAQIRGSADEGAVSWNAEGENFRQLVFYALLLEHAEPLLHPQAYVLEFIGDRDTEPIRREFSVSEQEKDNLRKLITAVWGKIQALDFTPLDRSGR